MRRMPARVALSANSVPKVPVCQRIAKTVTTVLSEQLLKLLAEVVSTVTRTPDGKKNNAQ